MTLLKSVVKARVCTRRRLCFWVPKGQLGAGGTTQWKDPKEAPSNQPAELADKTGGMTETK